MCRRRLFPLKIRSELEKAGIIDLSVLSGI